MVVELASISPLVQEQIPVEAWGTQALTLGFAGRTNGDSYRVLAAFDGTVTSITGLVVSNNDSSSPRIITMTNETVMVTNDAGTFTDIILEGPAVFQANQPIQVAHFANGRDFDDELGDSTEILLTPTGQYLTTNFILIPTYSPGFSENFINLIVAQSALSNTFVDGSAVAVTNFFSIANTAYYGARLSKTNGIHTIISSQPVGVEVYGFGSFDAYGYFGGVVK